VRRYRPASAQPCYLWDRQVYRAINPDGDLGKGVVRGCESERHRWGSSGRTGWQKGKSMRGSRQCMRDAETRDEPEGVDHRERALSPQCAYTCSQLCMFAAKCDMEQVLLVKSGCSGVHLLLPRGVQGSNSCMANRRALRLFLAGVAQHIVTRLCSCAMLVSPWAGIGGVDNNGNLPCRLTSPVNLRAH
jgi:hypothetical protein